MEKKNVDFHYPDESFLFSYREVVGNFTMLSNHFHNQFELYYLLSGERYYFIEDRVFHIRPGSLVLINEHDLHKTTDATSQHHERILINFGKDYFQFSPSIMSLLNDLFTKKNNVITLLSIDKQYMEALFIKMIHEIENKSIGFEINLQSLLMELLVYIRRFIEENNTAEQPSQMHKKILEIVQYINNNYSSALSLPLISKKFFISQYYLSRAFKQTTGFTFIEYVNSVRIREAQRLLRETDDKVIDIAEKIGYGNISHFGRVFKEVTSFTPLNYRKLNK
ncbi:helix-turn-helix transcriptional regulator [Alkaliphilus peptidifermentans]|uniref:AraC-type DNA-binding protein n=1 Tax=Alkaliphilus peptidifermentans DSM 18978 TaxID=1120976 RepID=A0A1G5K1D2_9FIRM|nr:AraC family transcriptional regulator [Alkaliphilus peptidifermentans]SCY94397.1 AraC-type DNA-binding protein [Alkaliphilus peptidifermentans DSM 18978]